MIDLKKEITKLFVCHYGEEKQILKACEELTELLYEVLTCLKKEDCDTEPLIDEMADVCVMIGQLQTIFQIGDYELQEQINKKIARTLNRLKNGNWTPCHYDGAKIVSPIYPPDGKWLEWINKDGKTQIARFKEDGMDHFYPSGPVFDIDEVVGWRELKKD